jgi:hypothetical protein
LLFKRKAKRPEGGKENEKIYRYVHFKTNFNWRRN